MAVILGLAWLFSTDRRAIKLKTICWGLGLQLALGFFVHSVLAVVPQASGERVLGLAYQKPWVRQRAPRTTKGKKQSRRQRARRERESGHWPHAVEEVGPAPEGGRWVHVGDRYADMYDFLLACLSSGCDVLVRAEQNRSTWPPAYSWGRRRRHSPSALSCQSSLNPS